MKSDALKSMVSQSIVASEVALRRRLQRAKREGDLPQDADPAELARYVMTVLQAMAVQGADGAGRHQLSRAAQVALRAWPGGFLFNSQLPGLTPEFHRTSYPAPSCPR